MRHHTGSRRAASLTQVIPTRRGDTTLADLIAGLQDTTQDDSEVVALVNDLMERGAVKARAPRAHQ